MPNRQYEHCNMEKSACYQVNLSNSIITNSSFVNTSFSNSKLSQSKFQNSNFKHSLYADLNLSHSKMRLVTLGGVRFIETNLGDGKEPIFFEKCELQGTQISNSNLRNVQIKNTDITGMTIDNTSVEELFELYYQNKKK